jgi:branched-chain amino acid transport system ATP-binding protein
VLEAKALEVRYGSAVALHGVDLRMDDHEMVALLGANGAGKTTLVKTLAGLLRPSRGTVEVTAKVAYVPEGRQLFPDLSVEDNLRIGAWRVKDRNTAKIYEYFPQLRKRARQRASTLSGGEQQMVAIGLAPKVVRELVGHLREFREASGMGLLLVEQNARLALEICERAYVLESGRMALSGPAKQIAQDTAIRRAYFGPQADES